MKNKGLLIIPYAYGGITGANIQKADKQMETYLKNICGAALSAKNNAGSFTDVSVVSNIDIPEPYKKKLISCGVILENCAFEKFNFGSTTKAGTPVRWQLAFYKLCALAHCVEKFDYKYFCVVDADVYIQRSFEKIWKEAENRILLYDLNEPVDGYMVKEVQEFLNINYSITHYGGEFFAASKELTHMFVDEAQGIYERMCNESFITSCGDEFITSIAADQLRLHVKNAGAYVRRYWTGSFRLVCNDYEKNEIVILHVPAEKEQGIIYLYDKYFSKGIIPSRKRVWRCLHLIRPSLRVRLGVILRKLGLIQ